MENRSVVDRGREREKRGDVVVAIKKKSNMRDPGGNGTAVYYLFQCQYPDGNIIL